VVGKPIKGIQVALVEGKKEFPEPEELFGTCEGVENRV
jgi:hypothetical protein